MDKRAIEQLLKKRGSARAAAAEAGVSPRTFLRRARECEIDLPKPGRPRVELKTLRSTLPAADREVRAELQTLGAPLCGTPAEVTDLEETLVRGIWLARRDATVACVLPLCLHYAADKLDLDRLLTLLKWSRHKRAAGFFFDLTYYLTKDERFHRWAKKFHTDVMTEEPFFEEKTVFSRKLAERNTPSIAKRWGWRMNMGLDAFESMFGKHTHA